MARHRNNPHMAFWKMLKVGNDHFEITHLEPTVDFCEKHYVFNAEPLANATPVNGNPPTLSFNATGRCPAYQVAADLATEVAEKTKRDDAKTAELIAQGTPAAPVRTGTDGGMNPVFLAKLHPRLIRDADGTVRQIVETNAPGTIPDTVNPPRAPQVAEASTGSVTRSVAPSSAPAAQQASSDNLFTHLFSSEPAQPAPQKSESGFERVKSSVARLFGGADEAKPAAASKTPLPTPKPAARPASSPSTAFTTPSATPAPTAPAPSVAASAAQTKPNSQPKAQEDAQSSDVPLRAANNNPGLLSGAQPVVPAGSFDSRWSGLH
jgi:hypothetical protein